MRPARPAVLLAAVLLALPPGRALPDDNPQLAEDEKLLKEAKLATDGPGLLDFFRQRTLKEEELKRVPELIRQLGDNDFETRSKAAAALTKLGVPVLPALRRAAQDSDAEVQRAAKGCIEAIEGTPNAERAQAAARLLADRKPPGAAGVLLAYLPFADNDEVDGEVVTALVALGVKDGKVDAALAAALRDKEPARRAAAAVALGRFGSADEKAAARKALADADAKVRFRAAQGLLAARDKAATPTLVALLAEGSPETARMAEDLLSRLAGEGAPSVGLGEDKEARKKCHDAWAAWWQANEGKIDLAKADVDLTQADGDALAKKATTQFIQAVVKNDKALFDRVTDVPFHLMGFMTLKTKDELAKIFNEGRPAQEQKITVKAMKPVPAKEEYLKKALGGEGLKGAELPEIKTMTEAVRKPETRLLRLEMEMDGRTENVVILLRVRGGKAQVIGFGPPEGGLK